MTRPSTKNQRVVNPFDEIHARRDALKEIKRGLVDLGQTGSRETFLRVRQLFRTIPGLREA